nr:MAG TPA: hypothetical protein [Bacteriophage sp.]
MLRLILQLLMALSQSSIRRSLMRLHALQA